MANTQQKAVQSSVSDSPIEKQLSSFLLENAPDGIVYLPDLEDFFESNDLSEPEQVELKKHLAQLGIKIAEPHEEPFNEEVPEEPDEEEIEEPEISENIKNNDYAIGNRDNFNFYLSQIGKYKLLTPEEEKSLGERISKGDKEAQEELYQANLRLVVAIAKNYRNNNMPLDDLVQEGNIGLGRAVQKFDYTKGTRFSTYATPWIKQSINRALADQGRTIRLPIHMVNQVSKVRKAQSKLTQTLGRDPTVEEVADAMPEYDEKDIRKILSVPLQTESLDQPVGDDGGSEAGDFVVDPDEDNSPTSLIDKEDQIATIKTGLDLLPEREKDIISLLYGLKDGNEHSLEEVGQIYGITRERVRQLREQAIDRMRKGLKGKNPND